MHRASAMLQFTHSAITKLMATTGVKRLNNKLKTSNIRLP